MSEDELKFKRLLATLTEANVEFYSLGPAGLTVKFHAPADDDEGYESVQVEGFQMPDRDEEDDEEPVDRYHHPSLWRNGKPPAFPTR